MHIIFKFQPGVAGGKSNVGQRRGKLGSLRLGTSVDLDDADCEEPIDPQNEALVPLKDGKEYLTLLPDDGSETQASDADARMERESDDPVDDVTTTLPDKLKDAL